MLFRRASLLVATLAATQFASAQEPPPPQAPAPQVQGEVVAPPPSAPELTDVLFKNLKARAIGPAIMGGRVTDIAIDPRNPGAFYVGFGTGGLFTTVDNGTTFDAIFYKESTLSIGAIGIAPCDPDVIWVGTGGKIGSLAAAEKPGGGDASPVNGTNSPSARSNARCIRHVSPPDRASVNHIVRHPLHIGRDKRSNAVLITR